jgi:hypothetical protein
MYKWVEALNDPANPQYRILLEDSVSAFLCTFEACVQFLKDQVRLPSGIQFGPWLANIPEYNLTVRALRTLRHFETHVDFVPPQSQITVIVGGIRRDGKPASGITRKWRLRQLTSSDLKRLDNPPLKQSDLKHWNSLADQTSISMVFANAIVSLGKILEGGEVFV